MLIEIHMLKNFPATNLNRDDTGAPKNCIFGGIQRGRISSQCLKRSWRTSPIFQKDMAGLLGMRTVGMRTRKMPDYVVERLKEHGMAGEYIEAVKKVLTDFAKGDEKGGEGKEDTKQDSDSITRQVVFYSPDDIQAIVETVRAEVERCGSVKDFIANEKAENTKKKKNESQKRIKVIENALNKTAANRGITLDMALFGRMVTSKALANVEASMQVAHAFSTNKVIMESDFFTAMDDMIDGSDEIGSAMMGDVDYNSSCYYIYASLDTDKLKENLRHSDNPEAIAKAAVPSLLRTMAFTNPSGKQNTFAGHALPSAVLVECKEEPIPVSYANAFVAPATAKRDCDLVTDSIDKLMGQVKTTMADFPSLKVGRRFWFCTGGKRKFGEDGITDCGNFDELVQCVTEAMGQ